MRNDVGYELEGKVRTALDCLRMRTGLFYYRFTDTKAAGNFVPGTPSDFIISYEEGTPLLLECKASEKHASLVECLGMIDADQLAYHKWWMRSMNGAWFLFYSDLIGQCELWDSSLIVRRVHEKIKADVMVPEYEFGLDELEHFMLEIASQ